MRVLYVTAAVVFIDQATKLIVKGFSIPSLKLYHSGLQLGESIPVLGDFFRITFIENPGMAFGIDASNKLFLTFFTFVATIGIAAYLYKIRFQPVLVRLSLALILGGAMGNLIDRTFYGIIFGEGPLFHGKVVDFFDVDFFDISIGSFALTRWFVFNIADAAVSCGVFLMILSHKHVAPLEPEPAPSGSPSNTPTP